MKTQHKTDIATGVSAGELSSIKTDIPQGKPSKIMNTGLWIVQVILAVMFLMAGVSKIAGVPDMVALFESIGFGQWFRYVTGILEVVSAVMIVVPFLASAGALLLASIMFGAILTHLFLIGGSSLMAIIWFLLAALVVWGRWDRTRPLFKPKKNSFQANS